MPHSSSKPKQKTINTYFSPLSPKGPTPNKHKKRKQMVQPDIINIRDSVEDSDSEPVKLAPSSQTVPVYDDESEDEEMPLTQSPIRRKRASATQVKSGSEDSSSDAHIPLNSRSKKRKSVVLDDSEEEVKPKKRRVLKKGLRPTAEEEDVMQDLDQDVIIESRLRKPGKKSAFTKNLERRRRQRLGLPPGPDSSENEATDENSSDAGFKPIPGARGPAGSSPVESDEASSVGTDDFVVEDDAGDSTTVELPLQFSMHRAQPLAVSFKVFFQLLVHIACQPSHLRESYVKERLSREGNTTDYLKNALGQLRKHVSSVRDSQVASSLWKYDFRNALEKRPDITIIPIDPEPFCDACRRSSAISTQQAHLKGEPYRPLSFQPLKQSDDSTSESSSSDSGESSETDDNSDREARHNHGDNDEEEDDDDETKTFNLGQHCARRVSLFHAFTHWEYELFQIVERKVLEIETSNRKRRRKNKTTKIIDTDDPDNIVIHLENRNVINARWRHLEALMQQANNIEAKWAGEVD
ncbi:hypothetical protein FRC17_005745 [Serendipita sp. 399]|nr:hypothetical protein FRC17_005745 [Serendipita sp. 399]